MHRIIVSALVLVCASVSALAQSATPASAPAQQQPFRQDRFREKKPRAEARGPRWLNLLREVSANC